MTGRAQPPYPDEGTPLPAARKSPDTVELLSLRRSTKWLAIQGPGPSAAEIDRLLAIAARVPDHGKIAPWRFIVVEGSACAGLGEAAAARVGEREPDASPERLDLERKRFANVPLIVVVVSRVQEQHKIPVWEQVLSSGAVCMNLLTAAHAMGYAGSWITEWLSFDGPMQARLGLLPGERIAGLVGIGSATQVEERTRPDLAGLVTRWTP